MKIKDIGDLIVGQVVSRIEAKTNDEVCGKIKVLIPKSIKNSNIILTDLIEINLKTEADEKKLTQPGDIILKLSQPYDAAYVTNEDKGILVTSFFILLRNISKNFNPLYITTIINSNIYKEQVANMNSGAIIPMLTKSKIENIEIEEIPKNKQDEIVALHQELQHKEKVFNEIIALERIKFENILRGEE